MKRFIRARDADEGGVVLVIVALAMVVLIGMLSIAIDASYGFVQNRRAQNASDFAAFAAAEELNDSVSCNGSQQPTMDQVVSIIKTLISANDPDVKDAWEAEFINNKGQIEGSPTPTPFGPSDYQAVYPNGIPNDTCGVALSVTPSWPSFFAGIFGLHRLGGYATASVAPTSPTSTGIGIVALNEAGPHEVLGGGTGKFVVEGTIFLNTNVATQPWSGSSTSISGTAPIGTVTTPSIVITTGSNNTLDIAVGGTTYPLTIAADTYTGSTLLSAVQTALAGTGLNAAYNTAGDLVLYSGNSSLQVTGGDALSTLGLSTSTAPLTAEWDDAIDAKADSNLYVYGTIDTNEGPYNGETLWPLDQCFEPEGEILGSAATGPTSPSGGLPSVQMSCTQNSQVTVDYNSIDPGYQQETDPLLPGNGGPPNPAATASLPSDNCPGMTTQTYSSPVPDDTSVLYPGVYTQPVDLTGTATFDDCAGYSGTAANNGLPEGSYPGIYVFQDGLTIDPAGGDTVSGSDIVIATQSPYPVAGNVPGSVTNGTFTASGAGNGAPCLPDTTQADQQSTGNGSPDETVQPPAAPCGGTNPPEYGVTARKDAGEQPDSSETGTGTNFSLIVGGAGTVQLTGPTTGAYGGDGTDGIVLYQDPTTPANYGFDAEAADSATIQINGVVYNASLPNYGVGGPLDFWDGEGGGVVFYQGGTLQTGYGTGWSAGPTPSSGTVTLNGTAVVDDFNTDGTTDITIEGGTYTPPSANGLQLIG